MASSEYHGPALGGTLSERSAPPAEAMAPAGNVIDFGAARARRFAEDGLDLDAMQKEAAELVNNLFGGS